MADGSIRIETEIDNKEALKNLEELRKKVEDNKHNLSEYQTEKFSQDIEKMVNEFERLTKEISTGRADLSVYQTDLDNLYKTLADAEGVLASQKRGTEEYARQSELVKELNRDIGHTHLIVDKATLEINKMESALKGTEDTTKLMGARLKDIELKAQAKEAKEVERELARMAKNTEKAKIEADKLAKSMEKVNVETKQVESSSKNMGSQVRKVADDTNNSITSGIGKIGKYALALFSIRSVYSTLSRASRNWINSDAEGASQVKANIEAISNAMSNLLAPVIKYIADLVMTLIGYLNAITKLFFGIDLLAKSTAKSTGGTGKNIGGATKGAKKLNKELKKTTASFDEIEKLSKDTDDNLGGVGGGGGAGGVATVTPQFTEPDTTALMGAINKLKQALSDLWESDTMQSFFDSFTRIGVNSFESVKSVASNLWGNVRESWEEASPFIFEGLGNMVEYWRRVFEDIADISDEWFPKITEGVNEFIDNIFDTFRPLTTFIAEVWRDFTAIMLELWEEYGAPILEEIAKFIDGMIETFNLIWTEIIDPILTPAIQWMKKMWDEHLKELLYELGATIGHFVLEALKFYNEFVRPIIQWLVEFIGPVFAKTFKFVLGIATSVFGNLFDTISSVLGNLRGVFDGFLMFLEGVFTGDWKKIWEGVVKVFSNIVGGIANIFKFPINVMIDGLNSFIRGVNKIKIPSFVPGVGGKGINIGSIPRLAQGGVITRPTQALIGEGGREVALPLDKNTGWMDQLAELINSQGGSQRIVLEVDGKTLAEIVNGQNKKTNLRMNGGYV